MAGFAGSLIASLYDPDTFLGFVWSTKIFIY